MHCQTGQSPENTLYRLPRHRPETETFGDKAKEEGFLEAASAFYQIAKVEHVHQLRFAKIAEILEKGEYFSRENGGKWICTNCGYIHEGTQAPPTCPTCHYDQGYFLPYELAPYL